MTTSPYLSRDGLLLRCFSCGAFRNAHEPGRWDTLPSLPQSLLRSVSHGLCGPCFTRSFGDGAGDGGTDLAGGPPTPA